MNRKSLITVLVAALILASAGILLWYKNRAAWQQSSIGASGQTLAKFPLNDVARLKIHSSVGELNLERKGEGWSVKERGEYPADFVKVSSLIRKFWELKPVQQITVGASQLGRLNLVPPASGNAETASVVELGDDSGKTLATFWLGKNQLRNFEGAEGGFPVGRYVLPEGKGDRVSLVSETFSEVEDAPSAWLKKDFIRPERVESVSLTGTYSWKLTRGSDAATDWTLADLAAEEKVEASKAGALSSAVGGLNFNDVLAMAVEPSKSGLDQPSVLTITTFDGFVYTLNIGKAENDLFPVTVDVRATISKERSPGADEKPEDKKSLDETFSEKVKVLEEKLANEKKLEGWVFQLPKASLDTLLVERKTLLEAKEEAVATPPATPSERE